MSRVSWHSQTPGTANRRPCRERSFFEKIWTFKDAGRARTETLPVDNYEFPFDLILSGSMPESVEGLQDSFITYRFKAEIGRKYAKDIIVRKPLRIIRTLDPSALELAHAMSVENVWPDKIEYAISTPSKAVIFGTSVKVDFRLLPLLKGLKIGTITSQLVETHELTLNPEDSEIYRSTHKFTRVIAEDTHSLGGHHHHQTHRNGHHHHHLSRITSGRSRRRSSGEASTQSSPSSTDEEADPMQQYLSEDTPGYCFSRTLQLPKTLSRCLQDCDTRGIKIKHKLKFRVQLHNPDGHTSELRATLPVSIFISPSLPLDEHNALSMTSLRDALPSDAASGGADNNPLDVAVALAQQAPPLYGEHQFDQLYEEVDMTGYQTPAIASGGATPHGPGSLSRSASVENMAGLSGLSYGMSGGMTGSISPAMLQHRLSNLAPSPGARETAAGGPLANRGRLLSHPALAANRDSAVIPGSPPALDRPSLTSPVAISATSASGDHPAIDSPSGVASPSITVPNSPPDQSPAPITQPLPSPSPRAAFATGAPTGLTPTYGLSRRGSDEDCLSSAVASGAVTPNPRFAEVEDLSRVPSYQTAMRSHPPRRMSTGLPDYSEAVAQSVHVDQSQRPVSQPQLQPDTPETGSGGSSLSSSHHAVASAAINVPSGNGNGSGSGNGSAGNSRTSSVANTPAGSPRPRFAALRSHSHSALSTLMGGLTGQGSTVSVPHRSGRGLSGLHTSASTANMMGAERPRMVVPGASNGGATGNNSLLGHHTRSHTWSWRHPHGMPSPRHGGDSAARGS
ncbi:hypothetical protein KEM52_004831 [Ascosphaera acerosa]|nr:hypothetical protein KEM52_004831 [Ascosphaera acerosa]